MLRFGNKYTVCYLICLINVVAIAQDAEKIRADIDSLRMAVHGWMPTSGDHIGRILARASENADAYFTVIKERLYFPSSERLYLYNGLVTPRRIHHIYEYTVMISLLEHFAHGGTWYGGPGGVNKSVRDAARTFLREQYYKLSADLDVLEIQLRHLGDAEVDSVDQSEKAKNELLHLSHDDIYLLHDQVLQALAGLQDTTILADVQGRYNKVSPETQWQLKLYLMKIEAFLNPREDVNPPKRYPWN